MDWVFNLIVGKDEDRFPLIRRKQGRGFVFSSAHSCPCGFNEVYVDKATKYMAHGEAHGFAICGSCTFPVGAVHAIKKESK